MDDPLWTTAHAPAIDELPQETARKQFHGAAADPVNLLVHGPPGAGKTAAVRAMAQTAHENPDSDFVELNVADFFDRSKSEIKNDPRFASFLVGKSDLSKRDMINYVLKESASYSPVTGEYKTLLLDNAEAIREDFQQALRRVMEQYHQSTQFVIATRQPSKLIPPLRSRCVPVPMAAPDTDTIADILESIVTEEEVSYERAGLEFIADYADGDLRRAILGAQTTAAQEETITMSTAYDALEEVGRKDQIEAMLADAEAGNFTDARDTLDELLIKEGLSAGELLEEILSVGQNRYEQQRQAELYQLAGDADYKLAEATSERVQLGRLLAHLNESTEKQPVQ